MLYASSRNSGHGDQQNVQGTTTVIGGDQEYLVEPASYSNESRTEKALRLAKSSYTLDEDRTFDNEGAIRRCLEQTRGPLTILGWDTRMADEQTFLITFSFETTDGPRSWAFEINPEHEVVRNVVTDPALAARYGYATTE